MSSRKRMNLKKTRLANHRKLYSRDLPVCKSKNQVFKNYTNTKRTQISVYIQKQKTRMRAHIFFTSFLSRVYESSPDNKDWESFIIPERPVGSDSSWIRECENSPRVLRACLNMSDLRCPRVLRKHFHTGLPLYKQSEDFLFPSGDDIHCLSWFRRRDISALWGQAERASVAWQSLKSSAIYVALEQKARGLLHNFHQSQKWYFRFGLLIFRGAPQTYPFSYWNHAHRAVWFCLSFSEAFRGWEVFLWPWYTQGLYVKLVLCAWCWRIFVFVFRTHREHRQSVCIRQRRREG